MDFRHLSARRALLGALLFSTSLAVLPGHAADALLRKPIDKGAYEMAYSPTEQALYVATSLSRSLDKGGIVYKLDPATLEVKQRIHNNLKPFGAAVNTKTNTLWFGNTVNSAVTAIDAKTGEVKGRIVLDNRERSETVKPMHTRELVVDEATNTVYVTGLGEDSVIWVIDGATMTLRTTLTGTGKYSTGLALDSAAKRVFTTNANGELIAFDTHNHKEVLRKKLLDDGKEHFFLNISLDPANHRAFITDSQQPQVLAVDTRDGNVLAKIDAPASLAVLFNPARNEVYVTHRDAGTVSVIDAKTYRVVKTIDAAVHPNSLALSPDGKTLYVSVKQPSSRKQEATSPDDIIRIAL
ncbi:YncE family protein [Atlantibacter sp.]|uniref:7-bladed beta-propeller protein YncE n=1 Tax=Atlantibacter sp. TaxID=1903473 RepID=UPI00289C2627|nr:YncE family protein [Atlantibacter sp.]